MFVNPLSVQCSVYGILKNSSVGFGGRTNENLWDTKSNTARLSTISDKTIWQLFEKAWELLKPGPGQYAVLMPCSKEGRGWLLLTKEIH